MKTNQTTDELGRQLRDEALADSPQFSPLLHARIMRQIQSQTLNSQIRPTPRRIHWTIPLTAAALLVITTTLWLHYRPTRKPTAKLIAHPQPSLPEITIHFPTFSEPANSPLTEARYGYLDRDARNVAHYVMDQFDVLPTPSHGRKG